MPNCAKCTGPDFCLICNYPFRTNSLYTECIAINTDC